MIVCSHEQNVQSLFDKVDAMCRARSHSQGCAMETGGAVMSLDETESQRLLPKTHLCQLWQSSPLHSGAPMQAVYWGAADRRTSWDSNMKRYQYAFK